MRKWRLGFRRRLGSSTCGQVETPGESIRPVTISERIARCPRANGFGHLRIGLAICVVCFHSYVLCTGSAAGMPRIVREAANLVLPIFFALSGFLVAGSLARSGSLFEFFSLRVLRICPALATVVLLSALVLGPILTRSPMGAYVSDPEFLRYFLNAIGVIHYSLPGVYLDNPVGGVVNGSLWTIPLEMISYLALGVLALLRVTRNGALFSALVFLLSAVIPIGVWVSGDPLLFGAVQGRVLVFDFLAGVSLFALRSVVPFHRGLALLSALLAGACLFRPGLSYLACFPIAYCTTWMGLRRLPRSPRILNGRYSYGLYLFAYPLQQALWLLSPFRMWWSNLALALMFGLPCAALSWRFVEKPILDRKHAVIGRLALWARSARFGLLMALRQ